MRAINAIAGHRLNRPISLDDPVLRGVSVTALQELAAVGPLSSTKTAFASVGSLQAAVTGGRLGRVAVEVTAMERGELVVKELFVYGPQPSQVITLRKDLALSAWVCVLPWANGSTVTGAASSAAAACNWACWCALEAPCGVGLAALQKSNCKEFEPKSIIGSAMKRAKV
jgi:hypothetical protein